MIDNLRPPKAPSQPKAANLVVYPRTKPDEVALNATGFLEGTAPAEGDPSHPFLVVKSQERLEYLPQQTLGSEIKVWGKERIEFSGKG